MSNIIGEGFDPKIIAQIKKRQEIYGSKNRTNEQLTYLNARTGWCRLVSSVDIVDVNDPNLRGIKMQQGANSFEFASQFILFNGTSKNNITLDNNKNFVSSELIQRAGVWPGTGNYNDYVYGLGGNEFGLRPMPGITQTTTKSENRGSLRTSTVTIKAHSREQFDIIDLLYLRLGFTMLLEWGNSSYFDNDGNYISENPNSLVNEFLLGTVKYENFPQKIREKILTSNGNYDAVIGKVVNFTWSFNKDGSYDITLTLRSMGDVIESLTTNVILPNSPTVDTSKTQSGESESQAFIRSQANASSLANWLYRNQQILSPLGGGTDGTSVLTSTDNKRTGYDDGRKSAVFLKQSYTGGNAGNQYYVKLATLLGWIQENIIPNLEDPEVKLLKINNRVKENIIYILGRQTSTDPRVVLFKRTFTFNDGTTARFIPDGDDFLVTEPTDLKNKYGYIMNAYFNMTFILNKMQNLINSQTGKVALLDLLNSIAYGWNQSTGYFNQLEFIVDYDTNEIKLIDQTVVPEKEKFLTNNNLVVFDVYGYSNNKEGTNSTSNFIRDINFTTTVSPNLASMLTIGAQANGYVVGQDATALSRMNSGLTDRFKPAIYTATAQKNQEYNAQSLQKEYQTQINAFNTFLKELASYNGGIPTFNVDAISSFNDAARSFYEFDQASQTIGDQKTNKNAASPNSGFLPFDLSLTMDGLSGMKIYQKFTIDTTYLPSNYPTALEFIIKGISHSISGNEWVTQIESMAIPKNPFGSTVGENPVVKASQRESERGNNQTTPPPGTSNADRLRAILSSLGYTEKGREISNGGDITSDLVDYAASVFREIKKQLPNVSIKVTGGNDAYHQRLSYKSSHTYGQGLDFTISPLTTANKNAVDKILGGFAAGNQDKIVSFINEYDYPSSVATAGHFHIRIGGKIESGRIATFIKQAKNGQLTTYSIA